MGQNVLHLATNWPLGMSLLLDYGAQDLIRELDHKCGYPVAYSLALNNVDSFRLLLQTTLADGLTYSQRRMHWSILRAGSV